MSDPDLLSDCIAALSGDFKNLVKTAVENIGSSGIGMNLARSALEAGVALERARQTGEPMSRQNMTFFEAFGSQATAPQAFRMIREQLGFSQDDIAFACGVSHATVSRWEIGDDPIPAIGIDGLITLIRDRNLSLASPGASSSEPADPITGADLRALRQAFGYRQTDMAEILGVHVITLVRWESKPAKPIKGIAAARVRPRFEALRAQQAAAA